MKIQTLTLENINSLYGRWQIDFAVLGDLYAIVGKTGAGKTSIFDAICLALFAKTPRANAISENVNAVMSEGAAKCMSEVDFWVGGVRYRARFEQSRIRSRKDARMKLKTPEHRFGIVQSDGGCVWEKGSKKEIGEKIAQILHMDFDKFTRVSMLAQGQFDKFLKSSEKDRAIILEKITHTQLYATIGARIYDEKMQIERQRTQLQQQLDQMIVEDVTLLLTQKNCIDDTIETQNSTLNAHIHAYDAHLVHQKASQGLQTLTHNAQKNAMQMQQFAPTLAKMQAHESIIGAIKAHSEFIQLEKQLHDLQEQLAYLHTRQQKGNQCVQDKKEELATKTAEHSQAEQVFVDIDTRYQQSTQIAHTLALLQSNHDSHTQNLSDIKQRIQMLRQKQAQMLHDDNALTQQQRQLQQSAQTYKVDMDNLPPLQSANDMLEQAQDAYQNAKIAYDKMDMRHNLQQQHDALTLYNHAQTLLDECAKSLEYANDFHQKMCAFDENLANLEGKIQMHAQHLQQSHQALIQAQDDYHKAQQAQHNTMVATLRTQLSIGAPCPVCASICTHPPARKSTENPDNFDINFDINQVLDDYAQAQAQYQNAQKTHSDLLDEQQSMIQARLVHLRACKFDCSVANLGQYINELIDDLRRQYDDAHNLAMLHAQNIQKRQALQVQIQAIHIDDMPNLAIAEQHYTHAKAYLTWLQQAHTIIGQRQHQHTLIHQNTTELDECIQKKQSIQAQLHDIDAKIAHTTHMLQDVLGHYTQQSIIDAHKTCKQVFDTLQKECVKIQSDIQSYHNELDRINNDISQKTQQLDGMQMQFTQSANQFLAKMAHSDIDSARTDFANKRMDDEQYHTAQKMHQSLQLQAHTLQLERQNLENTLATHAPVGDIDALSAAIASVKAQISTLEQQKGAIQQKIEHANHQSALQAQIKKQLAQSEQYYLDIYKLNEMIGDAKGMKYSRFVQRMVFSTLLELANGVLVKMMPRYSIQAYGDTMDIWVIDSEQDNAMRDGKNLSGGESFVVSLALALALANVHGGDTQGSGMLFIDEGFGTLDSDMLEMVLGALTALNQQGKSVGVISHVSALTENIERKIYTQSRQGRSMLTGDACVHL